MTDTELKWLKGPEALEEALAPDKGDRLPCPLFRPGGKKFACYQDPATERWGSLYLPKSAAQNRRPAQGRIAAIGDGYEPEDPEWDKWVEEQPYRIGMKIVWSRYHGDLEIGFEVADDWWDSPTEKERARGYVPFIVIHVKDVIGVLPRT
jgi:hypothetical protein